MTDHPATEGEPDLITLVKEIVHDSETLAGQQLRLLRSEVGVELRLAREAAVAFGVGGALVAAGGAFSALAVVHGLQRATRWPLWGCYGLVGGLLGAAGAGLLAVGRDRAAGVRLPPPETAAAFRENLAWLKEQVS